MLPSNMNVTESVVQEVASLEGVDPHELPPLYETVDPEALNQTLESLSHGEGYFKFTYTDYEVNVDGDGTVTVREVGNRG